MDEYNAFTPGLLKRIGTVQSLVVVKPSRIGDFICATPTLRALRAALPQARISLVTLPMLNGLAQRSPSVDQYISFPGYPGLAEQFFNPAHAMRFFHRMQRARFDLAVQLQGSGVYSNPFTLMLGAQFTAGFVRPGDPPSILDAALPMPQAGHEVERMLALSEFLGANPQSSQTEFLLWEQDHAHAAELIGEAPKPLIGVHPSARALTRRWEPARFAKAAAELQRRCGGTVVMIGEDDDRPAGQEILDQAGVPEINLMGMTSLPVLGAVIDRLGLLLTNDSGPAHIAYALKTPTVTIFGGEDLERYGPPQEGPFTALVYPIDCRPCGHYECPIGNLCLDAISVEAVVLAGEALMRQN